MKPTIFHYFIVVVIFLAGVSLLYIGQLYPHYPLLHEIGVLFVTVVPILFFYEFALRANFKKEMRNAINDAIEASALEKKLSKAIERSLPDSFHYLLIDGMVGAFQQLESQRLREWILNASHTEIRVSNFYIPDVVAGHKSETYVKAVGNGCRIKILIFDAGCKDTLKERAAASNAEVQQYFTGIQSNIRFFATVRKELQKSGSENKLELRLHQNFMSYSLWGFGEYYLVGSYHYGKSAVQGVQWMIHQSGPGVSGVTAGFAEIDRTFELQWERAQKQVVFEPGPNAIFDEANGCYVVMRLDQ